MADFDLLGDGLRKVLLAGIGALATGYEKSSELVDELVKKGEITVEQGKALNTELKRKVSETVDDANQEWWCLTKGGEMWNYGADATELSDGDTYELTFTVGY